MDNKQKSRRFESVYLIAIIALLITITSCSLNNAITGFAVLDNTTNETTEQTTTIDETTAQETTETITNETTIEMTNETKEKPDDKEKPESNQPPVWKADSDSIIIDGATIDLNDYFEDKNNDTIGYAFGAAEHIDVESAHTIVTFRPAGNNF